MSECMRCQNELRPSAKYCGHCGQKVEHAIQRVNAQSTFHTTTALPIIPSNEPLAAQMQIEVMTRLNPLMNKERIKAMVMAIAANGGTGTVGLWSDD